MADDPMGADKREAHRQPMILRVDYLDRDGFVRDSTENLSTGGIFIRTDRPFAIGALVKLALSFPGLLSALEVSGSVTWVRKAAGDQPAGVGIKVDGDEEKRRLNELAKAAGVPVAPGRRYKVLLVEDNPHVIEMYAYALKRLSRLPGAEGSGVEVIFAGNGHEAFASIKAGGVDLVVTDLYMPVMDGFQLLEKIRLDPATKAVPVLVVSAGGKDAKLRAEQVGADAFLQRPVRFVDVLETIRGLLKLKPA